MNKRHKVYLLLIFICSYSVNGNCQPDKLRLQTLVDETNIIFTSTFAQGVLLSPYEIIQHNRDRAVRNIEMVDSITFISSYDTTTMVIKNNETILHNPNDELNSRTYFYHKDGRISKVLKGRHLDDEYIYDATGYLVQHGHGGELKKAKRTGKTFEWINLRKGEIQYVTSYNDEDQLEYIKTMGSYNKEYDVEEYTWNGRQVVTKNTITKYKGGSPDTTFMRIQYDSLGLVMAIESRSDSKSHWSESVFTSSIEDHGTNGLRITLYHKEKETMKITFDEYDNWIELIKPRQSIRRKIVYLDKKRKK